MSGVLDLLLAAGTASGGGGSTPSLDWNNISGDTGAISNTATASMSGTIMVGAAISSIGDLKYYKNGVGADFTGDFPLTNGDKLAWGVTNLSGTVNAVGTITVTDDTNSVTIDTFTYFVRWPQ